MNRFLNLLVLVFAVFVSAILPAMAAVTNTPVFVQLPKLDVVQILPADTTTQKTLVTCATDGNKIIGVLVSSTDTTARDVTLAVVRSAVSYNVSTVTIAINAGSVAGTPPVNMISVTNAPGLPIDSDGNPFLFCNTGDTIKVNSAVTVTAAKVINAVAVNGTF